MNRTQEIESVKQLGEIIGYGNMMNIASALWADMLCEKHKITSGAFIPVLPTDIEPTERKSYLLTQLSLRNYFTEIDLYKEK